MKRIDRRAVLSDMSRLALATAALPLAGNTPAFTQGLPMSDKPLSFSAEMAASLPPGLAFPPEFLALFDFLEANGFVHTYTRDAGRYASLYPEPWREGQSLVTFQLSDPGFARAWTGSDEISVTSRIANFCRTGGDGSHAALWRDDAGKLWIVHMGSGSGSTWLGVITDKPIDFLRFLAIGYEEACWPDVFAQTPAQYARAQGNDEPLLPLAFRAYLEKAHAVTIPRTGSEIVKSITLMADAGSPDPFARWIAAVQNLRDRK
jgi:hypothetical protein